MRNKISRDKKVELLNSFLNGKISLKDAVQQVDVTPAAITVIYKPKTDAYRLQTMKHFVTKAEIDKKTVGAQTIFYIPDNQRDGRL